MTAKPRRPRGFSLVELMVASALVLVIFAAATYAVVNLHKRGSSEEGLADLQDVARGTRELVAPRIERAGAGLSNLMVNVDNSGTLPDLRNSFTVRTGAIVPPLAAYGALVSDSVELYWGETSSQMVGGPCGGPPGSGPRNGNTVCVQRLPTSPLPINPVTDLLLAVNPNANVDLACLFRLDAVTGTAGLAGNLTLASGTPLLSDDTGVPTNPCHTSTSSFWTGSDLYLVKAGGATFSIDWTGPNAVPRLMYDADGAYGPSLPAPVADNVERMQVRVGLISQALVNPTSMATPAPAASVVWFPDATAAVPRPPIDQCSVTNPACMLGPAQYANADYQLPDALDATDTKIASLFGPGALPDKILTAQLMRRARIVELDLTVRSARYDPTLVQTQGAGYVMDGTRNPWDALSVGNPLDGRSRRHFVMRVSLRNYGYEGS